MSEARECYDAGRPGVVSQGDQVLIVCVPRGWTDSLIEQYASEVAPTGASLTPRAWRVPVGAQGEQPLRELCRTATRQAMEHLVLVRWPVAASA